MSLNFLPKGVPFSPGEMVEYQDLGLTTATVIQQITGAITIVAFDAGMTLSGKITAFDSFLQVLEGNAEISLEGKSIMMRAGQAMIIPAHASNTIKAKVKLKILSTLIKSGYEEVS
jgi:quercetin dioxygenase-like cupin family protein